MSTQTQDICTSQPAVGDVVEVVEASDQTRWLRVGNRFRVDDVVPALTPDDADYGDPDVEQGVLVDGDGPAGTIQMPARCVKVVVPAAEVPAHPTPAEICRDVRLESDRLQWHTSQVEGDDIVFECTDTKTGADYSVVVRVVSVIAQ